MTEESKAGEKMAKQVEKEQEKTRTGWLPEKESN